MIFISLWVNDDCSLQSHDYPTICIMHVNRVMRISIFLCGQGFFSICFHFMIGKRYHVLWRFSSALCSFGICYVCEVRVLPPVKTVKINVF